MTRVVHDEPVIVERGGDSGAGMGMGVMLGVIMIVVLGLALAVFAGGRFFTTNPNNNTPAINAPNIDIQSPGITIPDRITIDTPPNNNTPPQPQAPAPQPSTGN